MATEGKLLAAAAAGAAAGVGVAYLLRKKGNQGGSILPSASPPSSPDPFVSAELTESGCQMPGTMVLCVQNLAVSGANQVLLNLAEGSVWRGNVIVLSPSLGPFAKEFADLGVVRFAQRITALVSTLLPQCMLSSRKHSRLLFL